MRFPQLQEDPSVHSDRRVNEQADVGLHGLTSVFFVLYRIYGKALRRR